MGTAIAHGPAGYTRGMKQNKACPKCESRDVGYGILEEGFAGSHWSRLRALRAELWVCTDCGYAETYFPDPKELASTDGFTLVNPPTVHSGPFR